MAANLHKDAIASLRIEHVSGGVENTSDGQSVWLRFVLHATCTCM